MFTTLDELKKYKFKPYEACPCGSEKKYKFCCYEKSKKSTIEKGKFNAKRLAFEGHKLFRDTDFEKCFGFDKDECSDKIIGAHSIQNNGVLDKIANNNHVYFLDMEFDEQSLLPKLKFQLIGKNKASKFLGFCKYHDKEYFSIIEDNEYEGTAEQNYWFAFRACCFELHRKYRLEKSQRSLFQMYPEATRNPQIVTNFHSNKLNIRDSEYEYSRFKKIYEEKDFEQLDSFVKVVPFKVGFTATTAVGVIVDIEGKQAVDIYDYDEKKFVPSIYISVIPKENESIIIVSRFNEDTCYKELIDSLRRNSDEEALFKYITFCLAEYSENVYFSPEVIDCLPEEKKDIISTAFLGFLSLTPEMRMHNFLKTISLNLFDLKLPL